LFVLSARALISYCSFAISSDCCINGEMSRKAVTQIGAGLACVYSWFYAIRLPFPLLVELRICSKFWAGSASSRFLCYVLYLLNIAVW
jgi:hypothetical protein